MPKPDESEVLKLSERLAEAEQTLEAIQAGSVDAVVVHGSQGPQIYTLESPDQPFRTLVESMQEGAITLGGDGTILYANPFFASLVARPTQQIVGLSFESLIAEENCYTARRLVEAGLKQPAKENLKLKAGARQQVPVQVTLSPLTGTDTPLCSGIVFDLRDREEAERAHAARVAAEQANAAKDRFLAMLSHELRSPLNTVLGWAQVLGVRQDLDSTVQKAVKAIERNARAQTVLIGELLDVSRIVTGKLHLERATVECTQIVAAAVAEARLVVGTQVRLEATLPQNDIYLQADAMRLQQVLTNLLNNALKFSKPGGQVEVTLTVEADTMVLLVEDDGAGIAAHELPYVFESFRQTEAAARNRKGGLGLGLTIVKQLVEAHGGSVRAWSPGIGKGASFEVRLPGVSTSHPESPAENSVAFDFAGLGVLVVDDDPDFVELTRYLLDNAGARVCTAANAREALMVLERDGDMGLLLSDIGLPEQDGLALLREVRARGFSEERVAAIALTGYAGADDEQLVAAAGFQMHLRKPVGARDLLVAVAAVARARERRLGAGGASLRH